jgi:hypothetical protein
MIEKLVRQVIQDNRIQSILLPMQKASPISNLGLFAPQRAGKGITTVAAEELPVKMSSTSFVRPAAKVAVATSVPIQPVKPSENALKYAEIFNQQALKLYPRFNGLFNTTGSVLHALQAWKNVLRPYEIENVKKNSHKEWDKVMGNHLDQKTTAQSEINQLLSTAVVPNSKIAPAAKNDDTEEKKQGPLPS